MENFWNSAGAQREEMQRALTVSTAGSILVQAVINRVVQALTLRFHGVWSSLSHKPGQGPAAYINRRAPGTTNGQWLADTTEPDEDTGTPTQATFTYRTALSRAKVTRRLQAIGRNYADNMAQEMGARVEDLTDYIEEGLCTGNNAASANQISGLLTLINAVSGQVVANTTANAGDGLRLSKLDEAIDLVRGSPADKLIFASLKGRRLLNNALQAQQRFNDTVEIDAGFRVMTYNDIPVITTTKIPDTMTWVGASAAITVFSGSTTTALVVVNKNEIWIEDLTPMSVLPLAKASSQYDQFDIFWDGALVHANTKGGAILGGLS